MLRIEARNAETPIERKPPWIKVKAKMGPEYTQLRGLVQREGLHTVCQEAGCPNIYECWEDREATFLIGGDQCTRRCDFCQIDTGKPAEFDADEPRRVGESRRHDGPAVRHRHRRRPRRPARRRRLALRRDRPPDPRAAARLRRRAADPRLQRRARAARRGLRRPPRGARAQRRDGPPHLQADPPRLPLRALPRRDHPGPRRRPGHQEQPDPGHGRGTRRGLPGPARPARRRLRADHHHPVPAAHPAAPPGRALGQARGVRRAAARRPRRSASPG